MAVTKSEKEVQTEIMKYVKANGAYCVKIIRANETGVHDLLMCIGEGLFVSCEVKAERFHKDPHAQMSSWQHKQYEKVVAANGIAICCATLEQFKTRCEHLMNN